MYSESKTSKMFELDLDLNNKVNEAAKKIFNSGLLKDFFDDSGHILKVVKVGDLFYFFEKEIDQYNIYFRENEYEKEELLRSIKSDVEEKGYFDMKSKYVFAKKRSFSFPLPEHEVLKRLSKGNVQDIDMDMMNYAKEEYRIAKMENRCSLSIKRIKVLTDFLTDKGFLEKLENIFLFQKSLSYTKSVSNYHDFIYQAYFRLKQILIDGEHFTSDTNLYLGDYHIFYQDGAMYIHRYIDSDSIGFMCIEDGDNINFYKMEFKEDHNCFISEKERIEDLLKNKDFITKFEDITLSLNRDKIIYADNLFFDYLLLDIEFIFKILDKKA